MERFFAKKMGFPLVFFLSVISNSFSTESRDDAGLLFPQPSPSTDLSLLQVQPQLLVLQNTTSGSAVDATNPVMISESEQSGIINLTSVENSSAGTEMVDRPIRICSHKDSDRLNECLRGLLEEIKPRIAIGIPEIGLPGIDPLRIPHLSFDHGSGSVKIKAEFNDVEITGLSNFNRSDFWVDVEKQTMDFDVTFPHTLMAGTYQLTGNLLFVPIAGNGHFWLNLGGVSSKGSGKLDSLITDGAQRRVVLHTTEVDLNIESIKVHLTNLFNGDRLLGSVINNFLNENSNEIFEELRPQIGSQVGEMLTLIANRALSALPADYFDDLPSESPTASTTTLIR